MTAITVGEALVRIRPDTRGFAGDLDKSVTSPLRGLGKVALGVGAGIAAIGTARFLAGTITDYVEAAKAGALTNQVIKSTGGIAGVSAKQVETLATKISNLSGIDDEAVQGAENMLLTFTNIGKRAFPDATKAVTDMATAMNGGLTPGADQLRSTAILVGKALNDPVRGLTALQRVGVRLTESQKEQVKTLVAANDTYGAQAIILGELSREFGGAAAAAADPISKLKVVLDNAKETIGGAIFPLVSQIVPVISAAVSGIAPVVADALGGIIGALQPVLKAIIPLLAPIGTALVATIGALAKGLAPLFAPIAGLFTSLGPIVAKLASTLVPVVSAIASAFGALLPALAPVAKALVTVIGALAGPLTTILTTLSKGLVSTVKVLAPVIAQIATAFGKVFASALKAIAPLLPELVKSFGQFLKALVPLVPPLLKLAVAVLPLFLLQVRILIPLMTAWTRILTAVLIPAVSVVNDVLTTLTTILNQITFDDVLTGLEDVGQTILDFFGNIPSILSTAVSGIVTGLSTALTAITGFLNQLPGFLLNAVADAAVWLIVTGVEVIVGLVTGIVQAFPTVLQFFTNLPGVILGLVAGAASWLLSTGIAAIGGLLSGLVNAIPGVISFIAGLPGRFVDAMGDLAGRFLSIGGAIINGIKQGLADGWHKLVSFISDKAGDLVDGVLGALGIGSPSKVFADKVGVPIVTGLQAGLAKAWPGLTADLTRRAKSLSDLAITPSVDLRGTTRGDTNGRGSASERPSITFAPGAFVTHIAGNADAVVLKQSNDELVGTLTATLAQVG